ncbi:PREDICTED: A-kinase anchor protein 14 [Charadrius vociferus]|uniref:A-kinase anchor protein 14 n=1 Tax=Charadrius vociferus TaxID=50402 RepID=UPI000521AD10|nr:PREDICTED: A-kinase anchor protein 14 [Charadrius vociferus]
MEQTLPGSLGTTSRGAPRCAASCPPGKKGQRAGPGPGHSSLGTGHPSPEPDSSGLPPTCALSPTKARAVQKQQQSLWAAVKTMDKGEENAASEEKAQLLLDTEEYLPELEKEEKESKSVIKSIQWVTGNNFTVEKGLQQIEEHISTWDVHRSWLHWSEFLREEELKYSKRYHYRVCWSVPTRRKPIPRATASVYFVIEISKTKPATLPVEVFFTLESSRLIHR